MKKSPWFHRITAFFFALSHLASPSIAAATASELGHWHGSLQTPNGSMALELNIVRTETGSLAATLESIDQAPGQLIPISRIQVDDQGLELELAAINASYSGRFDPTKDSWSGTWKQGMALPLVWTRGAIPPQPTITGMDGVWRGTLQRNGAQLRLILHISTTSRGTSAKLDSPDMGVAGLAVDALSRNGDKVRFKVPLANVQFNGTLDEDAASVRGRWLRQGQPEAMVKFVRSAVSGPSSQQRSQTPKPPFDYAAEEVTFSNRKDGISLAGTLTIPKGKGPFAAAVLISGSGPQDRDESIWGHKPFEVLADHLTRKKIAVLRFDDRGVGKSTGTFVNATTADFAGDVRSAVAYLAGRADIDPKQIGLVGHSEGGVVGPIVAADDSSVAFLILLAAPATPMSELFLAQRRIAGAMQGRREVSLARDHETMARIYQAVTSSPDRLTARARVAAMLTPQALADSGVDLAAKPVLIEQFSSDWLRELLRYDAATTLAAVRIPVLALNGSLDTQVPPVANLDGMRKALAGNPDATTRLLPGLNHMFQNARSGSIAEYAEISETFAPAALDSISSWIAERFPGQPLHAVADRREFQ